MVLKRVKRALPGVSGMASHRMVYVDVGEGLTRRRPSMRPCLALSLLVMVLVGFVFKSF